MVLITFYVTPFLCSLFNANLFLLFFIIPIYLSATLFDIMTIFTFEWQEEGR